MNSFSPQPLWRPRNEFVWDRGFCMRQIYLYGAEDESIRDIAPQDEINAFLNVYLGVLDPPCFNFQVLELFLAKANVATLTAPAHAFRLPPLALLDDRRDPAGLKPTAPGQPIESNGQTRNWDSLEYTEQSPEGQNVFREVCTERELYERLVEKRSVNRADRRVLHITDLTSLCGAVLAMTVAMRFAAVLRAYLQRYLSSQVYFRVRLENKTFTMEFHLPYFALRTGIVRQDIPRRLRQRHRMLKAIKLPQSPQDEGTQEELYYYDAQISFLLTGIDEWHWTAYCCVDTFFGSERTPLNYKQEREDGPSGGYRAEKEPLWNPREYFLVVLACRVAQITREWANIIHVLSTRLDSYEIGYNDSLDTQEFFDYPDLRRTRAYTRAVSILRQFHDMLSLTIELFQEFSSQELQYFQTDSEVVTNNWRVHIDSIYENIAELRFWQRTLLQRTHTFDRMKEGLVNSSALKESRTAVSQGDDIGVLTNMTVAYLPFGLAAALFSMPTVQPQEHRWAYWAMACVLLGAPTFFFAFGRKIRRWWKNGNEPGVST